MREAPGRDLGCPKEKVVCYKDKKEVKLESQLETWDLRQCYGLALVSASFLGYIIYLPGVSLSLASLFCFPPIQIQKRAILFGSTNYNHPS